MGAENLSFVGKSVNRVNDTYFVIKLFLFKGHKLTYDTITSNPGGPMISMTERTNLLLNLNSSFRLSLCSSDFAKETVASQSNFIDSK